jgi:hypothetical protein
LPLYTPDESRVFGRNLIKILCGIKIFHAFRGWVRQHICVLLVVNFITCYITLLRE